MCDATPILLLLLLLLLLLPLLFRRKLQQHLKGEVGSRGGVLGSTRSVSGKLHHG